MHEEEEEEDPVLLRTNTWRACGAAVEYCYKDEDEEDRASWEDLWAEHDDEEEGDRVPPSDMEEEEDHRERAVEGHGDATLCSEEVPP